jgi:hypothetical protein
MFDGNDYMRVKDIEKFEKVESNTDNFQKELKFPVELNSVNDFYNPPVYQIRDEDKELVQTTKNNIETMLKSCIKKGRVGKINIQLNIDTTKIEDFPKRSVDFDVMKSLKNPLDCRYKFGADDASFMNQLIQGHINVSNGGKYKYGLEYSGVVDGVSTRRDVNIIEQIPYERLYFSMFAGYDVILYFYVPIQTEIIASGFVRLDTKRITESGSMNLSTKDTSLYFKKIKFSYFRMITNLFDYYRDKNLPYIDYNLVNMIKNYM